MKERIITGVILGLVVLWAIFYLNSYYFNIAVAVILLLASWEWSGFVEKANMLVRVVYLIVMAILIYLSQYLLLATLYVSLLFWLVAFAMVVIYPKCQSVLTAKYTIALMGVFSIVPFTGAIGLLHAQRPVLLLMVMLVVTLADTGAYFVGKRYGKHKLAPVISPKKTMEGLVGGLVFGVLVGVLCALLVSQSWYQQALLIIFSVVVVLVALLGDLFESMIKRHCGIKDSGNILPGHGGMLDRMDSLFAALPIFVLLLLLCNLL